MFCLSHDTSIESIIRQCILLRKLVWTNLDNLDDFVSVNDLEYLIRRVQLGSTGIARIETEDQDIMLDNSRSNYLGLLQQYRNRVEDFRDNQSTWNDKVNLIKEFYTTLQEIHQVYADTIPFMQLINGPFTSRSRLLFELEPAIDSNGEEILLQDQGDKLYTFDYTFEVNSTYIDLQNFYATLISDTFTPVGFKDSSIIELIFDPTLDLDPVVIDMTDGVYPELGIWIKDMKIISNTPIYLINIHITLNETENN